MHRQIRRLQETGYVDITRRIRQTGGDAPNLYHLAYPKVAGIELTPEADDDDDGATPDVTLVDMTANEEWYENGVTLNVAGGATSDVA